MKTVVLQGSTSHESWVEAQHERELWGPVLGLPHGMLGLLEAHGFSAGLHPHRRYPGGSRGALSRPGPAPHTPVPAGR